jgi:hypothetical protein
VAVKQTIRLTFWKAGQFLLCLGLVSLVLVLALPAATSRAEGPELGKWVQPDHYPAKFQGRGYIDRVGTNDIVINDLWYQLSPFVKYHNPQRLDVAGYEFRVGKYVGFFLNDKREIVSLWLLE